MVRSLRPRKGAIAYDVVVCGGGPAGICAAVAAARLGANTLLIERLGFLGGTATAGMVTPISEFNKGGKQIIGGIPWEMALRMHDAGGAILDYHNGNVPFDQEIYKLTAQRMVIESQVSLMLDTWAFDVRCDGSRIKNVKSLNKSGIMPVKGKIFVDCTGDADVALGAGAPMQPKDLTLQPMTLWFRLGGVDTKQVEGLRLDGENTSGNNARIRAFLLSEDKGGVFGGPWFFEGPAPDIVNVNMTRAAGDATDQDSLQRAALELREKVFYYVKMLKEHVPAFHGCYLLDTAAQTGVRETRNLLGVHTVTAQELLDCVNFPDTIAHGAHPMDLHEASGSGQRLIFFDKAYNIPYRCMIAQGYDNLLVAGRCVSATREAQSTMRVQAPCMAEGEAAGCAAAICARDGVSVHSLDTRLLRDTLSSQGAIL
jgi:hypothetical protein